MVTCLLLFFATLIKKDLTLAHEVNESTNHEDRMKIEFQLWIVSPGERIGFVRLGMVLNDPEEDQTQDTMKQNLGDEDEESKTATGTARHFFIIALTVPEKKKPICYRKR